jgi:hypothetical protein
MKPTKMWAATRRAKGKLSVVLFTLLLLAGPLASVRASAEEAITIYYNRACADCLHYIEETIVPLLWQAGYAAPVYKDYVNQPDHRVELLARSEELGVPASLQAHLTVLVGERLILEGHIIWFV